ncbi:arsenate reductase/protein-tyrosine-phosphatase family protein [Erythrobacter sp. Dej080120_24]|uniref:arsenate reductase/protein-tyrosine-phosphatase family protein n=1 Tax=Erythrobacter sp. Dej080120_24 TaxID=3024837 RepID=UPI000551950B
MLQASTNKPAVLFVCLGNICRSPMAEGALKSAAAKIGLEVSVDSVGTANYHIGQAPDPRAIAVARAHGIDIGGVIGRQLTEMDFLDFTHIFALDTANMAGIKARAPRHGTARIALLLDSVEGREGESVPDPYYGDTEEFERCWKTIDEACHALARTLARDGVNARF